MKTGKTDRRVAFTKMILKDTLIKFMQDKHISAISVKSLCQAADINRSTFYAHFTDQYDLLHHIEQEVLTNLKHSLESQDFNGNRPISAQVLTRILEYAKDNADLFRALLSENSDFAFQKDVMTLAQVVTSQQSDTTNQRTLDYLQAFGITGCISVLQKWLQEGMVESPSEMTELILQVLYHGVAAFQE